MSDCDVIRMEFGAYVLGLLDPDDNQRVAAHLLGCRRCRAEVAELQETSALLGHSNRSDAVEDADRPGAEGALSAIATARRTERRRLRGALGSAGVLAVLTVALVVTLSGRTADPFAPDGPSVALRAESGVGATGAVRLSPRPWGTQIDLRVAGLPIGVPGEGYAVWLLRADGRRIPAGTFRPARGAATSRVRLAGAVPLAEVTAVGVSRTDATGDAAVLRVSVF